MVYELIFFTLTFVNVAVLKSSHSHMTGNLHP